MNPYTRWRCKRRHGPLPHDSEIKGLLERAETEPVEVCCVERLTERAVELGYPTSLRSLMNAISAAQDRRAGH
jgi:hypothetical protein